MNLKLKPRMDSVLPHRHPICALCDTHTLHPRLTTRSTDLTKPIGDHQTPSHELSEHHNTRISRGYKQVKPIQRP
jgi:hypothetical protein